MRLCLKQQAHNTILYPCVRKFPYSHHLPFIIMAKAQDARKEKKKEPTKTTKEKKAAKEEKKQARARKQD